MLLSMPPPRLSLLFTVLLIAPAAGVGQEGLAERVRAALAACELQDPSRVRVSTSSGVVTLGGSVRTLAERECLAVQAERVGGVRYLQPRTVVRPGEPVSDEQLVERVRGALRARTDFQGPAPLTVTAEAGRVLLGGEVRVPDDKYRAGDAVRRVEGVLELENAVRVDPQQGLRSMEVQLLELFSRREVPVTDLRFLEREGRVYIEGRSHDVLAQELVEEFTRRLPGGRLLATRIHVVLAPPADN